MFPPDGLLSSGQTKYDVKLDPHIIAPDPFASDDCLDDLILPAQHLLLNSTEELSTMNPGADEPSAGLNGRLRPRKSNIPSPQSTKSPRRLESKTIHNKVKSISTSSKTPPNKPEDLTTKSDITLLCPYCDRKFSSKQALTKHVRRIHGSSSKQDSFITCLFCNHYEAEANNIVRHMADSHPQQYFACVNCHARYSSSSELAEHKNQTCDLRLPYRSKLRQKVSSTSSKEVQNASNIGGNDDFGKSSNVFSDGHGFNGIVISCEPALVSDGADIEDNITTNLILPPCKKLGSSTVVEKNAVIVLDDLHWNKRIPPNFSFHNTDADQILSRLGVVHRSPRTGESSKRDWKTIDDSTQKFEKCFDTSFYSKVASNVHENLSKFLDGSFNFNPDPDSTIKTRKSKNSVQINTAEGFPILLASEQYSRNAFDRYMPRAIAPKHKWKWDSLETEKSPINPDQIKRDSHTNNCIITLVSSLDIWTQLRMRKKFEEKFGCPPLVKKTEKQTIISNELKDILESRELPAASSQVVKVTNYPRASGSVAEFPASLGLGPSTARAAPAAAVLSGEWVRPRCYVCCACGEQSRDSRLASTHASTHHPNAQVQHYEIVGEQLLNADILKHLYVPPGQMCNRTRPLRGFRECTKCSKSITLEDLHQHMLDCAGDTPAVRRKCRYRPFGVRRRRPRLPDNTIRKKIRKEIRTRQTRPKKSLLRPRPTRTEVGDAETIRKMIADLPAKRHRVPINPSNQSSRPRIKQRSNLLIKGRSSEDYNKRKKRNNKDVVIAEPESPINDETSTKSDEDKPLKPKAKKMTNKILQRMDIDKRNTMGRKRPKRRRLQGKEVEKNNSNENASNPDITLTSAKNEELSLDNSSKKIDINNVEFKSREHVGRGNSGNRDGQRPGCSGQNSNSRNQCAPVQNVPLKHSIARLTADSEKHDKSVQFHHLFLVQQECNNVNQHVPSGQQLLFENEAAVLTLDKPPLHSNSKQSQDSPKSKLNKPRKGLNACIAMLKNKLVDPAPNSGMIPTGHVSVQCGSDEPLYIKPDVPLQTLPEPVHNAEAMAPHEQVVEKNLIKKTAPSTRPRRTANQEKKSPSTYTNVNNKHQKPTTSSANIIKDKPQTTGVLRESGRRKSIVSELKVIEITTEPDNIKKDCTPLNPITSGKTVSPKAIPIASDGSSHEKSQSNPDDCKPKLSIQETVTPRHVARVKSNEEELSVMSLNKPYDLSVQETETHIDATENRHASIITNDSANPVHSDNYGTSFTNQQPVNFNLDGESNNNTTAENYLGSGFNDLSVNIRPAHASTNVESLVAIPLDLSGKVPNTANTQDFSNHGNTYLPRNSYESYETLDLSNKTQDVCFRTDRDNLAMSNEIVDLSIKSLNARSVDVPVTVKEGSTDLSHNVNNDVPTDLTVKKKSTIIPAELATPNTQNIESTLLYNESTNNRKKVLENETAFKSPTNLSVKGMKSDFINLAGKGKLKASVKEQNVVHQQKSKTVVPLLEKKPDDIEDKACKNSSKENTSHLPITNMSETSRKNRDEKKNDLLSTDTNQIDKISMQVQKPIYDPTLKIPQYRIRVAATIDAAGKTESLPNASTSIIHTTPISTSALPSNYTDVSVITPQDDFNKTSVGIPIDSQGRTYDYVSAAPVNTTNSSTGGMFYITNCGVPSQLSKFENTTPVCTLAKACTSVTKIESTNAVTLTNTVLTPEITLANTNPVYTLTGTTMGLGANYSHIVSTRPSGSRDVNDPSDHSSSKDKCTFGSTSKRADHKEISTSENITNIAKPLLNTEHDPETAKKIALLPKELLEILGNMPVDHRNQLLNVLPQYVSTPTSVASLQCDISNYSESAKRTISLQNLDQKEITVPSVMSSSKESDSKKMPPIVIAQEDHEPMHNVKNIAPHNFENTSSLTALPHHTNLTLNTPIQENSKTEENSMQQLQNTKEEPQIDLGKIHSDPCPRETFPILTSNRPSSSHNNATNKVIDLTEDETVLRKESHCEPPLEVSPQLSLLVQPKRNKTSNDQTASLRAVRIKAPAERKKSIDNQILKQTSPVVPPKICIEPDNEVKKSLHVHVSLNTDITLAIQQAEVSSTQHGNKNVAAECKFAAISPNTQESNEINNCTTRRKSSPDVSKEVLKNVDDTKEIPIKSVAKSTLVTSSILNNATECVGAEGKKWTSPKNDLSNSDNLSDVVLPSDSNDYQIDKNYSKTSILHKLDISNELDTQIQSLNPDYKSVLEKHKGHTLSHSTSNICEEDSDDDLSLAVICQQKQQHHLRKEIVTEDNAKRKDSSSIKRKTKRNKKKLENLDTGCDMSREKSLCNNNIVPSITLDKNCHSNDDNLIMEASTNCAVIDKEAKPLTTAHITKKKTFPRNKITAGPDSDDLILSSNQINYKEMKSNQIETKESCAVTSEDSEKSYKVFEEETNQKLQHHADADLQREENHLTTPSITPIRQRSKKKKLSLVDSPHLERTQELNTWEPTTETTKVSETEVDVSKKGLLKTTNPDNIRLDTNQENVLSVNLHANVTSIDHNTVPSDMSLNFDSKAEESDSKIVPLRRSRRGKSLNNSIEDEDVKQHTETLPENRTPLTKKQLIFSKLLLDEENNTKHTEGTTGPVKKKATVPEVDPTENVHVVISENKNKPIKRKKSPHLKRKYKKKKSFNNESYYDEEKQISVNQSDVNNETESRVSEQNLIQESSVPSQSDSNNCAIINRKNFLETDKDVLPTLEKRKSGDACPEPTQIVQPKKSKLNEAENSVLETSITQSTISKENKINDSSDSPNQSNENKASSHKRPNVFPKISSDNEEKADTIHMLNNKGYKQNETDLRVKTCYNMPIAGRRTRSKSAVTKSAIYDPYDIDMDDMIEPTEPLRHQKISSERRFSNNAKQVTFSKKSTDSDLPSYSDIEQKKQSRESYSKNNISDSDDSSKSDVPLKKYAEEKEKRMNKLDESVTGKQNNAEHISETCVDSTVKQDRFLDKNKRTLALCINENAETQDDTEEQLRSEQFMESFGFFSERKPRKSNLLATKKISETFHIIANECDDMYFGFKDKCSKKSMQNENIKSIERETNLKATRQRSPLPKKVVKRGRKKKTSTVTAPSYCHICKKEFRRPDNYLRHQMTLIHVSKLSEVELKIKTIPIQEEPNYLLAYKEHLDRMKAITDKITKRKKNSKSAPKIIPLTLEEILADVNKIVREQQLSQRGLSCDEELFLDCCELLKESHKKQDHVAEMPCATQESDNLMSSLQPANVGLDFLGKSDIDAKCDGKNDGDVDSITAKTILESEEVRNLENDLISGLKEAACNASNLKSNIVFQHIDDVTNHQEQHQDFDRLRYDHEPLDDYEEPEDDHEDKTKKYPEFKEKMYPDIEEIDMFEDKFDKIKRKCRSQAAAAKQTPLVVGPSTSRKGRKKSEKKKGKKSSRRNLPSAVLTKGALKGFDGIKVSIPTSDINISAIVSPLENPHKKRKKGSSKKRRENKNSESSSKYDSDQQTNERSICSKNVDVYEFMDNEDVELFEFRPSTLMERFKSISNKETPSTSRVADPVVDEAENSIASASDGDDFVYMSDDYVCSDEETENSLMSCDVSNAKAVSDIKKLATQMKRRDAIEKNAVMGKIFKNNAVRSERKPVKNKEQVKPKANLDQLFDSLLEDEPNSSMLNDESLSFKDEVTYGRKFEASSPIQSVECMGKENYSSSKQKRLSTDNDKEVSSLTANNGPTTCKITMKSLMGDHRSIKHRKRHSLSPQDFKSVSPIKYDTVSSKQLQSSPNNVNENSSLQDNLSGWKIKESKTYEGKSPVRKIDDDVRTLGNFEYNELCDESITGVARQRARRKCTVGKQNVLAESWSSESEPDGGPPRPRSAESIASAAPRKKKGKRKDGHHTGGRRSTNRHISFKKQDIESRVNSSNRNTTTHTSGAGSSDHVENRSVSSSDATVATETGVFAQPAAPASEPAGAPQPSTSAAAAPDEPAGGRLRTLFWTAEGAAHEQQLRQQHGWIVGDSHKKLVTMLAQAKRRKRNNDDKRHVVE